MRSEDKHKSLSSAASPALSCFSAPGLKRCGGPGIDDDFEPFIAEAFVSLLGYEKHVSIRFLHLCCLFHLQQKQGA